VSRPLRVAFVAYRGNMKCGGQGVYLWFLTRELARQGIDVDVFVGPPYPDSMPFARHYEELANQEMWAKWFTRDYAGMLPEGTPTRLLSPLNFYELAASRLGFLPEPAAFSVRAFRLLAARRRAGHRWDLVHDVQCLGWGLLGLRALGIPVVTTVHHPLTVDRRASFGRDESLTDLVGTMQFYPIGMQSFVARHIDRVLTSSETSAREIIRDFKVSPERVTNVWNGLDTELYSPDRSVPKRASQVLCVGRAQDPNKGIKTLIQAIATLPRSIELVLVDNDSPDNPVRKWARRAGMADRLTLTGKISTEELVHRYREATLVAVPSRYEGFGLPAVEAMACGTPVVATSAGALSEVVGTSGGGLLVEPDDGPGLAKALSTLLEQPEARQRLAERARERVVEKFSWAQVARATAEVYRDVLDEAKHARQRHLSVGDDPPAR